MGKGMGKGAGMMGMQGMQQRPAGPRPQGSSGLNPSALAQATPAMQKQMVGEKLYAIICKEHPDLAGKITGMLLEMDTAELLGLLESPPQLKAKVTEARRVLSQ